MKKPYNFFLDIDGTILCRGKTSINDAVLKALEYAHEKGSKIFINTGRTRAFVPYGILTLDCVDGFCCGCGTYVEYQGKKLYENYLSLDQIISITDEFLRLDLDLDLMFEGYDRMYYIGQGLEWHTSSGFIPVKNSDYFKNIAFDPKIHKMSVHTKQEKREDFFKFLSNEFVTLRFDNYCESIPLGFDKGKAIKLTEDLLGLDHTCSVAIGDSMNDEAMLRYAAISVAMGNAPDEVKSMCDIVTDTCDNDGVAKIIYSLLQ